MIPMYIRFHLLWLRYMCPLIYLLNFVCLLHCSSYIYMAAFLLPVVTPLLQLYVYGVVPPVTDIFIDPLLPPKHDTSVVELVLLFNAAAGWVMVIPEFNVVHPCASVTVTAYVPAAIPVIFCVIDELLQLYIWTCSP